MISCLKQGLLVSAEEHGEALRRKLGCSLYHRNLQHSKDFAELEAHTKFPVETQARLSPSMERGGGREVSLLAEEVLTTDSSWRQSRVSFPV